MKRSVRFTLLFFVAMAAVRLPAQVRDFTMKDGTTLSGELSDYNQRTDMATFRDRQGRTAQFNAHNLVDADFVYVRDWDAVRLFSRNTHFRIYLGGPDQKNRWTKYLWFRPPGKLQPDHTWTILFKRMAYSIKFDNMTGYDLENVSVKYCIYYEQERLEWATETRVAEVVVRPSVRTFPIVPNGSQRSFDSNPVVLRDEEYVSGRGSRMKFLQGEGRLFRSKMIGMVFRAEIQTASGLSAVREVRMPRELSEEHAWIEPTPGNAAWPDDELAGISDMKKPPTFFEEQGGSLGGGEE